MSDNIIKAREFCDLMAKRHPEALRSYFTPDVVYQNTGMPAVTGVDAIVEDLAGQMAAFPDSYSYRVMNLAANGDVVLSERLDMIRGADGAVHGVPVMGVFAFSEGKISRWTDYWDTGLLAKMMAGENYRALVPQKY